MKEKINWWWWFLIAAVVLPLAQYLLTGYFIIHMLRSLGVLFVIGLNPFIGTLFTVLPFLILTIFLKIIARIIKKNSIYKIVYSIIGIVLFTAFWIDYFIAKQKANPGIGLAGLPRRYILIGGQDVFHNHIENAINYFIFFRILEIVAFLACYIVNYNRIQLAKQKNSIGH